MLSQTLGVGEPLLLLVELALLALLPLLLVVAAVPPPVPPLGWALPDEHADPSAKAQPTV